MDQSKWEAIAIFNGKKIAQTTRDDREQKSRWEIQIDSFMKPTPFIKTAILSALLLAIGIYPTIERFNRNFGFDFYQF